MLDESRHQQYLNLMRERGWELLLFYGDGWRKEHFRCLLNLNFSGSQILGVLHRSGQVDVVVTDPWDLEFIAPAVSGSIELSRQPALGLADLLAKQHVRTVGINGMDHMPARLVQVVATAGRGAP